MTGGYAALLPRADREQVLAAVAALEGEGPVTIGRIAQQVAGELGIDMQHVDGAYDLRRLISWGGLQTEIKHLVDAGLLVRWTEREWNTVTRGAVFTSSPSATTWAYCTKAGSRAAMELHRGDNCRSRRELSQQYATLTLVARHAAEHAELVAQWLDDNPAVHRDREEQGP